MDRISISSPGALIIVASARRAARVSVENWTLFPQPLHPLALPMASLQGKTCVITGGTDGIGRVAAERIAELGARMILVGRNRAKGEAVRELLAEADHAVELLYGDLGSIAECRRIAREIGERTDRIDLLLLNAGAIFQRRETTVDGLERTFALNHMGYFLLGNLLLNLVKRAAPARIVIVASEAHRGATLDFSDLQSERGYSGWPAYKRSKLMNILFARELARRLDGSGVTANALHPGFVASSFGDNNGVLFRAALGLAKRFGAITPAAGGAHLVFVATAPEVAGVTGKYFRNDCETRPTDAALDDAAARRLWDESARIAGL
jgi:NAD(P)-dependent dehydrogenase (short-subunit alcohol dehydrogenase family)